MSTLPASAKAEEKKPSSDSSAAALQDTPSNPKEEQPAKIRLQDQFDIQKTIQAEVNAELRKTLSDQGTALATILEQLGSLISAKGKMEFEEQQRQQQAETIAIANAEREAAAAKIQAIDRRRRELRELDKQAKLQQAQAVAERKEETASLANIEMMFDSSDTDLNFREMLFREDFPAGGMDDTFDDRQRRLEAGHLTGLSILADDPSAIAMVAKTAAIDPRNVPPRMVQQPGSPVRVNMAGPSASATTQPPRRLYTPLEAFEEGRKTYNAQNPYAMVKPPVVQLARKPGGLNLRNSLLVKNAVRHSDARRIASMDTERSAVQMGKQFQHPTLHIINHYTLSKFVEKAVFHDSNIANDRVIPGRYLDPLLLRRLHGRLQQLSYNKQLLLDYNLVGMVVPSEDMLSKMELDEWYSFALKSLICHSKTETELTWMSAYKSLATAYGFEQNTVIHPGNIDAWEGFFNAKLQLSLAMMSDGMQQYSQELNLDGSRKESKNFCGVKPNVELRTQGFYRILFSGPGFLPQQRGADGQLLPEDLSLGSMRHAIASEMSSSWTKHPDFPTYQACIAFEMGRISAAMDKLHLLRRATSLFVSAYNGTAAGSGGVPLMHDHFFPPPPPPPAPPPKLIQQSPPDHPPNITKDQYTRMTTKLSAQQAESQGITPPWMAQRSQQAPRRRFSDSSARPPRQQLNLMEQVEHLEKEYLQQQSQEEQEYQAHLTFLQLEEERLQRESGTGQYADDHDGYYTADEGGESHGRSHDVDLHQAQLAHSETDYAHDAHMRRVERLDVLPILATLPIEVMSKLPLPVRQRVESFRSETMNRASDRDNSHRNDSPQWQSQRNSDRSNPGRLVETQKKVTFGNAAPKGACTAHLKGQCTKGDSCYWSHDWDVCEAEAERIAENRKSQRALRAKSMTAASISAVRQQTNTASGVFPQRTGSSADHSQEE